MFKKSLIFVLCCLFLVNLSFTSSIFAQESSGSFAPEPAVIDRGQSELIMPPFPQPDNNLPLGQNHQYTVTLRGNGEAIIALKMIFSNFQGSSMSAVSLTFPEKPENLSVFQVHREPYCISYKPHALSVPPPPNVSISPVQPECERYQEPDYLYGWEQSKYFKAEYSMNDNEMTVNLPLPVKPNGNGALVISYAGAGITTKDWLGAYNYDFKTVMVDESIQSLTVGVNVDPDYYLKDAEGEINYHTKDMAAAPSMMMRGEMDAKSSNARFDQYYNSIGQGIIVKSASNFQPGESFTVSGTYADNRWQLYAKEIGIGSIIFLFVIIAAALSIFIAYKKFHASAHPNSYVLVISSSLGSSLLIVVYTFGLYLLNYFFTQAFPIYNFSFFQMVLLLMLAVISLGIYSVFLFGPAVFLGIKRGLAVGASTFALTIFWLICICVIVAGIYFMFFGNKNPHYMYRDFPGVMPMGGTGFESKAAESSIELRNEDAPAAVPN